MKKTPFEQILQELVVVEFPDDRPSIIKNEVQFSPLGRVPKRVLRLLRDVITRELGIRSRVVSQHSLDFIESKFHEYREEIKNEGEDND